MKAKFFVERFTICITFLTLFSCMSFSEKELINEIAQIKAELNRSITKPVIVMLGANCYCPSEFTTYDIKLNEKIYTVRARYITTIDDVLLNSDSFTIEWRYDLGARNHHPTWKPFQLSLGSNKIVFLYFLDGELEQLEMDDGLSELARIRLIQKELDIHN